MSRTQTPRLRYVVLLAAFMASTIIGLVLGAGTASAAVTKANYKVELDVRVAAPASSPGGHFLIAIEDTSGNTVLSTPTAAGSGSTKNADKSVTYHYITPNLNTGSIHNPTSFKACQKTVFNTCVSFQEAGTTLVRINVQPNSGGVTNNKTTPNCETVGGGPLDWLLCGIFDTISVVSNVIFNNFIIPLLRQAPIPISDSGNNKAIYEIWSNFRIYADIFLVIALVIVVIMQAVSGGTAEVYTAKKALPKLLAAAILINLSIYIVAFMVDATNVIGAGVAQIITAPLANSGNLALKPGLGTGALFTGGALVTGGVLLAAFTAAGVASVAAAAIPFLLVNALLPLVIGFIIAFIVLALRQALIILLVIVSPVAFALWFLPNTESVFKRWWSLFFEVLMVYPIAVLIFTVFNIVAVILGGQNGIMGPMGPVIAVVIEGVSLIGFIYAFRFASQTVGKIHEVVSNRGNQLKEFVKGNPNDPNSLRNRTKGNLGHAAARANAGVLAAGKLENNTTGGRFRRGMRSARAGFVASGMFGNVEGRLAHYQDLANKKKEELTANSLDDMIYAAGGYQLGNQFFNSKGEEIAGWEYRRGKSLYGNNLNAVGSALGYRLYKSQSDQDIGQMREAFMHNAINNNWSDEEAQRVWAAATYPYKTMMGSEWYSAPKLQRANGATGRVTGVQFQDVSRNEGNYGKYVEELHKTRSSFRLSDVRDGDWRAMADHQAKIQARLDDPGQRAGVSQEELVNFAKTSEVLDAVATPMRQGGYLQYDAESGEVNVSGLNPAAQPVVQAMYSDSNRRYGVTHAKKAPVGGMPSEKSENERIVYERAPLQAAQTAKAAAATTATGGQLTDAERDAAIAQGRVGSVSVTGDAARSTVPK